jgi:hypothetical protein
MNDRIRFEETKDRLNLWVDEHLLISVVKKFGPFHPAVSDAFDLFLQILEQQPVYTHGKVTEVWKIWLRKLYEEGKL